MTCGVGTIGHVSPPGYIESVLELRPKLAVEPRLSALELSSLVRRISRCALRGEANRCISEGADAISRRFSNVSRVPARRVASFLMQQQLCVLPADKEGSFVVLENGAFNEKACCAVANFLNECHDVSLREAFTKRRASIG